MQLYFALEKHDSASVVAMLDRIKTSLSKELCATSFSLILTDNSKEFSDIQGMERSVFGVKRTLIFFCEPNRSEQKAQCETNHINSYVKKLCSGNVCIHLPGPFFRMIFLHSLVLNLFLQTR